MFFFQDVNWAQVLREGLKAGFPESEIWGSLKNLMPEKIGLWAKFNRHIHVLVLPKFGGAQYILKRRSNDHPIKTNTKKKIQNALPYIDFVKAKKRKLIFRRNHVDQQYI